MQLRFGVLGEGPLADGVFNGLDRWSRDSNPGLALELERGPAFRLGRAARSAASWQDEALGRSFHLDGVIYSIDGEPTSEGGLGEADQLRLAALYDSAGGALWERLEGSFCLVIVDGTTYHLGVDVSGTRGVYWWTHDGLVAFHSNLMDLAPVYPGVLVEDDGALGSYLISSLYPATRTAYRQIQHLGAGQCLVLAAGQVVARSHFEFACEPDGVVRRPEVLAAQLNDLVAEAVALTWDDAKDPVVPLSGGMDSRYLAAEITRQKGPVAKTITWGQEPERPDSDAVVASRVAAALGVEHTWLDKIQGHTVETFARAIYLSSGEADCAIHYPADHLFHADLTAKFGFSSLFRGDEQFGTTSETRILTTFGAVALSSMVHLSRDHGYEDLIERHKLDRMGSEQAGIIGAVRVGLQSSTPQGQRQELVYGQGHRRELAIYNTVKNAEFEVFTPLMNRSILEWLRRIPDGMRAGRPIERTAIRRRYPELVDIPYATRDNLPDWRGRSRIDPSFSAFLRAWFTERGWLDSMGTRAPVLALVDALPMGAMPEVPPIRRTAKFYSSERWKVRAKKSVPGRLLRELTLERRYGQNNLPVYIRLSRLAVLHGMLGDIDRRRIRS